MSQVSVKLGVPLPGAIVTSKRLLDIQAVKDGLIGIDAAVGSPNGLATLGPDGKLITSQRPETVVNGQPAGYLIVPQRETDDTILELLDSGGHLYTELSGVIWTIPSNAQVAFPVGSAISFVNGGTNPVTININTDTLIQSRIGVKTSLILAPYGLATVMKVKPTKWIISGDLT
jgi:hypothetical protein